MRFLAYKQKKILVCGAGSIGIRHLNNVKLLGHIPLSWRFQKNKLGELTNKKIAQEYEDLETAIKSSDAVIIATKPSVHLEQLKLSLKYHKPVYIEKPISNDLIALEDLNKNYIRLDSVIEVGCMLRSHENIVFLKNAFSNETFGEVICFLGFVGEHIKNWRKTSDFKKSFSISIKNGGGVLFELIHEIDLVIFLLGEIKKVSAICKNYLKDVLIEEATANLTLELGNGISGQLQMDMLSPTYRREFHIVTEKGLVIWNYKKGEVSIEKNNNSKIIHSVSKNYDRNTMFLAHLDYFIARINNYNIKPRSSLEDGIHAVKVVTAARESNLEGKRIKIF